MTEVTLTSTVCPGETGNSGCTSDMATLCRASKRSWKKPWSPDTKHNQQHYTLICPFTINTSTANLQTVIFITGTQAAEQLDFKITEIGRQANAKWRSHKFEAAMQPSQLGGSGVMPPPPRPPENFLD
jgi:hypothetical protein